MWNVVQLPTAAASTVLVVNAGAAQPTAVEGILCAVLGCLVCIGGAATAVVGWLRLRDCRGLLVLDHSAGKRPRHSIWSCSRIKMCIRLLMEPRSVWIKESHGEHTLSARAQHGSCVGNLWSRTAAAVLRAVAELLLDGCHVPHSWVIVYDAAGGLIVGVLLGIASSADVSCTTAFSAMWIVFCVTAVQTAVAAAVRPRTRVIDCVFEVVMGGWTVGALLAVLGIDEGTAESATAQAAVAVLWSVPAVALRLRSALLHSQHLRRRSDKTRPSLVATSKRARREGTSQSARPVEHPSLSQSTSARPQRRSRQPPHILHHGELPLLMLQRMVVQICCAQQEVRRQQHTTR